MKEVTFSRVILEKEMTTHSSILAWEIPWTEKPGGLQSTRPHESDRHDLTTKPPPPRKEGNRHLGVQCNLECTCGFLQVDVRMGDKARKVDRS